MIDELDDVAHRWKSLGTALRVRHPVLVRIEKERRDDAQSCLSDMVTEWLNQSYNTDRFGLPSWEILVNAVYIHIAYQNVFNGERRSNQVLMFQY